MDNQIINYNINNYTELFHNASGVVSVYNGGGGGAAKFKQLLLQAVQGVAEGTEGVRVCVRGVLSPKEILQI